MPSEIDIDDPRFTQTFVLPPDPASNRNAPVKVTYAECGYRNEQAPEEAHVVLFFGTMTASRWLHIGKESLAKVHKVRFINMDRPGFGGSDDVAVADRMSVCRAASVALLQELGIRHVFLAAHSGGVLYALDFALHHPEMLHPDRPYIAMAGPWILPSHTGVISSSILKMLPEGMLNLTDKFAKAMNNYVGPAIGKSFGLSEALLSPFVSPPSPDKPDSTTKDVPEIDKKHWKSELSTFRPADQRLYAENIRGLNDESLVLLQKGPASGGWSDWGDYDSLIPRLEQVFRSAGKKLRVDVFYAESDGLIGDEPSKGAEWFDALWQAPGREDVIEYHRSSIKKADHDSIWQVRFGVARKVFEYISGITEENPHEEAAEDNVGGAGADRAAEPVAGNAAPVSTSV